MPTLVRCMYRWPTSPFTSAACLWQSYLRSDIIIAAAKAVSAETPPPGYGFLSENPGFVRQVTRDSLVFIGQSVDSICAMGIKNAAKRLMEKAAALVIPGYLCKTQEIVILTSKAREIGFPVLIKAHAGGDSKGMHRVDHPDDFVDAFSGARRKAKAAFGNDRVLVEKYVDKPRHVEVQVFGYNFCNAGTCSSTTAQRNAATRR